MAMTKVELKILNNDNAEGLSKHENAKKIKILLDSLPAKIDQIREYEIGINIKESERASDIVVLSAFDSLEDLGAYSSHPEHRKAVEYILKVSCETRAVDFET